MRQLTITKSLTNRNSQSLQYYFNELNHIPRLTDNEENEIAYLAHQGDEKAREKLIKHNLRFVVSVAKQYQMKGVNIGDLINEGNIGLIKAANKFDPTRGFKFISYAVWLIRQTIIAYINQNRSAIRKPINKSTGMVKVRRDISRLEQKLEREPSYYEIYDMLNNEYSEDDINFFFNNLNDYIASLDAPLMGEGTILLGDTIKDKSVEGFSYDDSKIRCEKMLDLIDSDERNVLTLLYGLNGDEILTVKEASEMLGIFPARLGVIKNRALRKLNYRIRKNANWLKEMS